MNITDKITQALDANSSEDKLQLMAAPWGAIASRVPGWSRVIHYLFFKSVFQAMPEIKTVLILGVYMGRDITIMLDVCAGRALQVVGVDRFADQPCDDWAPEKKGQSWAESGFGDAPDIKKALDNINPQEPHQVKLIQSDSAVFLANVTGQFDFIYIDTSHDYDTVKREIEAVRKLCHPGTLIAGDDFINDGKEWWGVDRAVADSFKPQTASVLGQMIWYGAAADLK